MVAAHVELTVLCICALTTGLTLCFAGLLSFQVMRCFEELFFLGARDRVGATVLETRAPDVDAPQPAPPAAAPEPAQTRSSRSSRSFRRMTPCAGGGPV